MRAKTTHRTLSLALLLMVFLIVGNSAFAQQRMLSVYDQTGSVKCVVAVDSIRLSRQGTSITGLYLVTSLTDVSLPKKGKVTVVPRLFTATDSVDFPEVELRSMGLTRPIGPMDKSQTALPYSQHTAYQPWMEQAQLKLIVSMSDGNECLQSSCILGEEHMMLSRREVRTQSTISDIQQLRGHAYITFAVNKTDIRPELGRNRQELKTLNNILDSLRNLEKMYIPHFALKGYASPEGPYARNEELSRGRVESLRQYLVSHYNLSPDIISTAWEAEDWVGLRQWVAESQLTDSEKILTIIDSDMDPDKKLSLIQQRHPAAYMRMSAEAFPLLRHTDYSIDHAITKDSQHEDVQEVIDTTYAYWLPIYDESLRPVINYSTPAEVYNTPLLAVKTNLLLDAAYVPGYGRWCPIPNIAVEYYPQKGHFTYGASFDMPWWQDYKAHKFFQFRNYQIEGRYYFNGANKANGSNEANEAYGAYEAYGAHRAYRAHRGFYLQGYAHAAVFGICFDENRGWVGEGFGAGIGAGYVTPLSKNGRWKLEFSLQAGFFACKYDPYQYENPMNPDYHDGLYYYKWTQKPEFFKKRQYRWNWLGPTRVGITLSYNLLYRKSSGKGVTLKSKERRAEP